MNIGLYDVDSRIPNLALMKLSSYHKSMGHSVELYQPILVDTYDKIYASKIFDYSDGSMLIPEKMEIGGTGYDLHKKLPKEVESHPPDYSLYNYKHSMGFTMRGCRLKCSFCVVPRKEGAAYSNNTIEEIWTQRGSSFVMLLDNDFFGNPCWRERVDEIKKYKLKVNFCQGLNIRNIKEDQAKALASINFRNTHDTAKQVYFAWDDIRHEKLIHKGIKTCADAGIRASQMAFYVLIGYNSTEKDDLYRIETLRNYGCDPYVMPFDKNDNYQKRLTRWVNHKAIFKSVSWGDYLSGRKNKVIDEDQMEIW